GGGGSTSQTHSPSHSPVPAGIAEAPGDNPSTPRQPPTHGQHLSPADANQTQQQHSPASSTSSPAVETQHVYPKAEPQATHPALRQDQPQQQQQQQQHSPYPQIPPRQPHRKSTDRPPPQYTDTNGYKDMPASPSAPHNNFSYPNPTRSQERLHRPSNQPPPSSSSPETMHPGYHPHPHHPSTSGAGGPETGSSNNTFHSLKSAAIGLHGVGETLRGTLNSEVDNRLQRRNPDKNSAAREKNAQVMQRGEREMAGLREGRGLGTTVAPAGGVPGEGEGEAGSAWMGDGYVRGGGVQQVQRPRGQSFGHQQQQYQQGPPMPKRFYGNEGGDGEGEGGGEGGQQQQQRRRERSSSRVQALSQTNGGGGGGGGKSGVQGQEKEREREKEKEGKGGGLRKFLKGR
ncbi:hypothetical protein KC365_g18788, partial [Hortaea werneckii]